MCDSTCPVVCDMRCLPGRGSAQRDGCVAVSGSAVRVTSGGVVAAIGLMTLWAVLVLAVVLWFWKHQ